MSQQPRVWLSQWIHSNLRWSSPTILASAAMVATTFFSSVAMAEVDPQVSKGLGYKPRQSNIQFDQVQESDLANCVGKYEKKNGVDGLSIYGPNGQLLRRFNDSNNDRQVDQWCYYKDGIEVYRDVDSDFNNVADQYRWLGTAGTRWGIDKNEDGKIDEWKTISAEEVTIELVEAIKTKDEGRFARLLISNDEISRLGLESTKSKQLQERVDGAKKGFKEFVSSQKLITPTTKWTHFAADKPGVIPAGTDEAASDIVAYENVISILDADGTSQQLMVGSLVQQGSTWKLIDLPKTSGEGTLLAESGFFFPTSTAAAGARTAAMAGGSAVNSEALQGLLADLEKTDTEIRDSAPTGDKLAELHDRRAKTLVQLVNATKGSEEMELWVRQFVDSVASAAMQDEYPNGLATLQSFESQLPKLPSGDTLMPYVTYRVIMTDYQLKSMEENANFAQLQDDHMANLTQFAEKHPESTEAADAMIQIALNHELSGAEDEATSWYSKVAKNFPETGEGRKAEGAVARLSLEGRTFSLSGNTLDGKTVDTKQFAGTPVIVHYWASWCEPCKKDMERMRNELARNPRAFNIVGINLDNDRNAAIRSLPAGLAPWAHIHEGNGFESDSAIGLGVLSAPVTILIDARGTVVKRGSHFSQDIEDTLKSLIESSSGPRNTQLPVSTPAAAPNNRPGAAANNQPGAPAARPAAGSVSGGQPRPGAAQPGAPNVNRQPAPGANNRAPQRPPVR